MIRPTLTLLVLLSACASDGERTALSINLSVETVCSLPQRLPTAQSASVDIYGAGGCLLARVCQNLNLPTQTLGLPEAFVQQLSDLMTPAISAAFDEALSVGVTAFAVDDCAGSRLACGEGVVPATAATVAVELACPVNPTAGCPARAPCP